MIVENSISAFGVVFLFITGAIVFLMAGLLTGKLLRPNRPNAEKLSSYECGEDPVATAWGNFNVRFYVIALIFVLFDVEIVFLFPWTTVFADKTLLSVTQGSWGWFAFLEILVFVGILALGLAYAWAKGFLEWVKPEPVELKQSSPVPFTAYEEINKKYSRKVFTDKTS